MVKENVHAITCRILACPVRDSCAHASSCRKWWRLFSPSLDVARAAFVRSGVRDRTVFGSFGVEVSLIRASVPPTYAMRGPD